MSWEEVEKEFDIPYWLTRFRGKIDAVSRNKLWLKETKTKSRIDVDNIIDTLSLNLQINIYCWALEQLYKKQPKGVIYDVIRKPGLKLNKGENLDQYKDRLKEHVNKDIKHYFKRFKVYLDWHHISLFGAALNGIIKEFSEWVDSNMYGQKFGMPCVTKYGLCKFVPICHYNDFSNFYIREKIFEELE